MIRSRVTGVLERQGGAPARVEDMGLSLSGTGVILDRERVPVPVRGSKGGAGGELTRTARGGQGVWLGGQTPMPGQTS